MIDFKCGLILPESQIIECHKISEEIPLQDRNAFVTNYGLHIKYGSSTIFGDRYSARIWYESKEERDSIIK